jgi:hypothetical protein
MTTYRDVLFRNARFALGHLTATPGGRDALREAAESSDAPGVKFAKEALKLLQRHAAGDWGEVSAEDKAANDRAVEDGTRVISAYKLSTGVKVWVITEANRASTTILLPEEY